MCSKPAQHSDSTRQEQTGAHAARAQHFSYDKRDDNDEQNDNLAEQLHGYAGTTTQHILSILVSNRFLSVNGFFHPQSGQILNDLMLSWKSGVQRRNGIQNDLLNVRRREFSVTFGLQIACGVRITIIPTQ